MGISISASPVETIDMFQSEPMASPINMFEKPKIIPTDQMAQDRAEKADYGLGELSPGIESLLGAISTGNEDFVRDYVSKQKSLKMREMQDGFLRQYIKDRGDEPVSEEEALVFKSMTEQDLSRAATGDTIFEEEFARRLVEATASDDTQMLDEEMELDEEGTFQSLDVAQFNIARQQVKIKMMQDLQVMGEQRTATEKTEDFIESIIPFKTWWDTQNAVGTDTTYSSLLMGNNWEDNWNYLDNLSPADMHVKLTEVLAGIGDINSAKAFLSFGISHGTFDVTMGNAMSILDLTTPLDVAAAFIPKRGLAKGISVTDVPQYVKEGPQTFTTAKGSTYVVNPDGTTTRNKAARKEHPGDSGPKPKSAKTIYVTEQQAQALAPPSGKWKYFIDGDTVSMIFQSNGKWGSSETSRNIKYQTTPRKGLVPLELWVPGKKGGETYSRAHFGNKITKVEGGIKDVSGLQSTLINLNNAASEVVTDQANILAATNNQRSAAILQATKSAAAKVFARDPNFRGIDLWNSVPVWFNPKAITHRPYQMAATQGARLEEALMASRSLLQNALTDIVYAQRLSPTAHGKAVEKAMVDIENEFVNQSSSIIDVRHLTTEKANLGNIDEVELRLGKTDASLFTSKTQANAYAKQYGLDNYNVLPEGKKFYISVIRDVAETGDDIMAHQVDSSNKSPESLIPLFLSFLRSPDHTQSTLSRANRHVVTHATQEFNRYSAEVAKSIGALNKKSLTDLEDFLNTNRDWHETKVDPKTNETYIQKGRFFNTLSDLESEWSKAYGRLPTPKEAEAYFKFVQLNDLDYVVRNLGIYRDLARQGVKQHQFRVGNVNLEWMNAKEVGHLPLPDQNMEEAGILFVDKESGNVTHTWRNDSREADITKLNSKYKKEGYRVFQIAAPDEMPFKSLVEEPVNFVVIHDAGTKALDFKQIPYAGGGHVEYTQQWYLKQAKVKRFFKDIITMPGKKQEKNIYMGDSAYSAHTTEAEARKIVPMLETARKLVGNWPALKTYLETNLPTIDPRAFNNLFKATKNADGSINPPTFSKKEPFVVAYRNDNVMKSDPTLRSRYANLQTQADSSYNLMKSVSKEFTGPRDLDLKTFKETPSGFKTEPAAKLSSLEMLSKASSGLVNQRFFKDYQMQAVSSWLKEFEAAFDPLSNIYRDPLKTLMNPQWDNSASKSTIRKKADENRKTIISFLNLQNDLDQRIHMWQHRLVSQIYNIAGQKVSDLAAKYMIVKVDDPFKHARAIAFHPKLGLFNPAQLFVQSQTLFHSMAITGSPTMAASSLAGGFLMTVLKYSKGTPKIVEAYANKAAKLGWTKEEFLDSYALMRSTGWDNIEGEIGYLDNITNPPLFKSNTKKFLDKGAVFFKAAERNNRMTAWNIAYKEFKRKYPTVVIGDRHVAMILKRADDLTVNMTGASNSRLQKGVFSLPLQFFTYQQRLMEQMLGKTLTRWEKIRVFTMYSALYGVPVATGAVGGVMGAVSGAIEGAYVDGAAGALEYSAKGALGTLWPYYDDIRTEALKKGVDTDNGLFIEALTQGIPAVMLEAMFGNEYNGGQRYGPGGMPILKAIIDGDKGVAELAFGVSGTVIGGMLEDLDPIFMAGASLFNLANNEHPVMLEDFTEFFANVSSFNNAHKAWGMFNTGRYITEREIYVQDRDTWDALITGVLGMSPRSADDIFRKINAMKDLDKLQKPFRQEAITAYRRSLKAVGDEKLKWATRARTALISGGFLPHQMGDVMSEALGGQVDLESIVNRDFYTRKVPADEIEHRFEQYKRMNK
jgi:hypothetical protein